MGRIGVRMLVVAVAAVAALVAPPAMSPAGAAVVCLSLICPTQVWQMEFPGATFLESSPGVVDLDGDGVLDVVVGDHSGWLRGLRGTDGSNAPGWPQFLGTGIDSSPAAA